MKKTLFLTMLLAACFSSAQAATYTNLTESWCDEVNNIIYDGKGYFAVKSGGSTSVDLTIDLAALQSYVNSNDYSGYSAMLKWDVDTYDYGIADNADISLTTGSRTAYLSGMNHESKPWNSTTNNITYNTLTQYATNGYITLNITNTSGSEGVTIKTTTNAGETVQLYSATGLKYSATATSGYYVNLNYVTEVTLNTVSTLDTGSYVPPVDYSAPFESTRKDGTTIGRVTFLGDSITHGVNDQSYRWQLFKTLTDNGIENEIAGPREGYYNTPGHTQDAGSNYGGAEFKNVHLAQASGRTHNIISGSNSGMTGVNYGGHSTASTSEKFDSNTWFCMMGTNDLLSDTPNSGPTTEQYVTQMQKMLGGTVSYDSATDTYNWVAGDSWGNMGTIVDDVYTDGDTFYMLSITPWGNHNNHNRDMDHYAAQEFNRNLGAWAEAYSEASGQNVVYVDVTRGMVDHTSSNRFMGHDAFFNSSSDRLHPNEQGSLIMAGNLAQAMGIGGRTAGLERSDAGIAPSVWHSATVGTDGTVAAGSTLSVAENIFTQDLGYSVDFSAAFGNGASDGWLTASAASMNITVGDGINSGTLSLSEGYIMWGDKVLYCQNTSDIGDNLRVVWHNGNTEDNVLSGYYVWLGDMLIGQGLSASETASALNGITISASGAAGSVTELAWANTAYAPTTTLITSAENAYRVTQAAGNTKLVVTSGVSYEGASTTNASNGQYLVNGNTTKDIYTGILSSADASTTQTKAWVGMVNTAFSDDINVQYTGNINATIFGAMDNGNGAGAGRLVLDIAAGSIIGTEGTYDNVKAAIAGSYGGGKADAFNVYINGGQLENNVVGGSISGAGSINSVLIALNSGKITGNIYGGSNNENGDTSKTGVSNIANAVVGKAQIIVNGGEVTGNIVAGGSAGTIGNVDVLITDGTIGGNITKGAAERQQGATTNVTVVGNKASIGGNIEADTVTLQDVDASESATGFDKYSNIITADKLVLNNVQTNLGASVKVTEIEVNGSNTSLIMSDFATLKSLTFGSGVSFGAFKTAESRSAATSNETTLSLSNLTVGKGATLNANIVLGKDSILSMEGCLTMGSSVALASCMTIDLTTDLLTRLYQGEAIDLFASVDSLTLDGLNIDHDTITEVSFNVDDMVQTFDMAYSNAGTVSITLVPEPATATLSLLALAGLAARRRRK